MIGIEQIASYLPPTRASNFERKTEFEIGDRFIEDKIGFRAVARMGEQEDTSVLCEKAYAMLIDKTAIDHESVQAVVVVTQNPDRNIPHVSAVLHGRLGLPQSCACFDLSLGCSGYVQGLSVVLSFMASNGMKHGLLFTADPYSKVVDEKDKNTVLLFGDGATVTYLSDAPCLVPGRFSFGTIGRESGELCIDGGKLHMNGRAIFNFAARHIPADVKRVLIENDLSLADVDSFIFHQGSRYIVDTIAKALGLPDSKVPFVAADYGNTVSSSVPMVLETQMQSANSKCLLVSGFGVGLSWASTVLRRVGAVTT
jgi:3-oxoacyl-[acyl-carrier-protein] synthase-3